MTVTANIDVFADRLRDAPDAGLKLLASAAAALRDDRALTGAASTDETVAGAFLDAETPVALSENAADAALARIDAFHGLDSRQPTGKAAGAAVQRLNELMTLPDAVREAAFEAIVAGKAFGFAGFGIRRLAIPMEGEGDVDLLRIEPGAGVATHDHTGEEFTLVLTGAFHDGHRTYRPGDINVGVPGFRHEPKAMAGEVCYALAVSYGPARFEGPIGLLQKLTGFGS